MKNQTIRTSSSKGTHSSSSKGTRSSSSNGTYSSYSPYSLEEVDVFMKRFELTDYFNGRAEIFKCLFVIRDLLIRIEKLEKRKKK